MYEVVRDPECSVRLLGTVPRASVIVTLASAGIVKSIGSDQTSLPCAIVTDALPAKDSALSVVVSMLLSTAGAALQSAT